MSLHVHEDLLIRLEEAEAELNRWIAEGRSLEICDELADLSMLAGLAGKYRDAASVGDSELLEALTRRVQVLLLPKSDDDRLGSLLLFHSQNDLATRLEQMYIRFAEGLRCRLATVVFSDGTKGLCIRSGDLLVFPYQELKNESGVHLCGGERCAVSALPLRGDVSSDGYSLEAFPRPDDRRFHRLKSCVRASRDGLVCESLSMRSAVQNRDLALSALAARLENPAVPVDPIRDYDFSRGILTDRRLGKCFSIDDLQPLFDSLLLAE